MVSLTSCESLDATSGLKIVTRASEASHGSLCRGIVHKSCFLKFCPCESSLGRLNQELNQYITYRAHSTGEDQRIEYEVSNSTHSADWLSLGVRDHITSGCQEALQ